MRQVGVLAAAGIIALTKMVERLADDHERAKRLADAVAELPGIELDPDDIQTDIVIFGFKHPEISAAEFLVKLKQRGILALTVPQGIRFVTNKEIDDEGIERTAAAFKEILT